MRNLKRPKTQLSCSRLLTLGLLLVLASLRPVSATAATAETKAPAMAKLVGQRTRLNDAILRLSQPAKCKVDSDCASAPMGVKPCGGPWKYVLYSKTNSKIAKLKTKLADYNKLDQQLNESQQSMSDCSVTLQPNLKCEHFTCIDLSNANAANASAGLEKITPAPAPHH